MAGLNVGSVFFELGYNRGAFTKAVSEGSQRVGKIFGNTFSAASKQMKQQMSAAGKSVAATSASASKQMANSYTKAMDATKIKALDTQVALDAVNQKMKALSDAKKAEETGVFEKMTASIKTTEAQLDSLIQKQLQVYEAQRESTGKKHNMADPSDVLVKLEIQGNKEFNDLDAQIERLTAKLDRMQAEAQRASQSLASGAQPASSEYKKLQAEADKLNTTLTQQTARTNYYQEALDKASGKQSNFAKMLGITAATAGGVGLTLGNAFKKATDPLKKVTKGLKDAVKQMGHATKSATGFGNAFAKLGTRLKNMVLMRLVRNMVSQVGKGFQDLAKVSQPFNAAMSQIQGQAYGVRNALASAVAPVVQALAPAFTYLTNAIISCLNTLAMFMAKIFGSTATFYKATVAATDYAAALGSAGSAAKKAKGQLAGFDELNNLNQEDDSSSGGGGGAGAGSMFEKASISEEMSALFDDAFKLGETIGQKINEALGSINWGAIQSKVASVAEYLGTLLNGISSKIDWYLVGSTLGEGINTVLTGVYTFVKTFDWLKFGKDIATGLSGAIATVNWDGLGRVLASKIIIVTDWLYGFVTTFSWAGLGNSISTAINAWFDEINWARMGEALSTGVQGLLGTIKTTLQGINWQDIGTSIAEFLLSIDWAGIFYDLATSIGELLGGMSDAFFPESIGNAIRSFFEWVGANGELVISIILSFAAAMLAVNIATAPVSLTVIAIAAAVAALVIGITLLATHWEEIWGAIKEFFIGIWTSLNEFFTGILTSISEFFINIFNGIRDFFVNLWNGIVSFFTGIWNGISNFFTSILTSISDTFTAVWTSVKDFFVNIFNSIKEFIVNLWTGISTTVGNIVTGIKNTFVNVFTSMKDAVVGIFTGIWNGIKGIINGILGGVESLANGVVSGVNMVIGALNTLKFGPIPDWVPVLGGKEFGFNIPTLPSVSLPRLAKGGIVDNPTVAMIGEAGKEAVVPLENNTGWMVTLANILADALISKLLMAQNADTSGGQQAGSVKLEIDGREMGEVLLDYILDAAKRRGIPLILATN